MRLRAHRVFAAVPAVLLGFTALSTPAFAQIDLTEWPRLDNGAPVSFAPLIDEVAPAVVSLNVEGDFEFGSSLEEFGFDEDDLPFFFPGPQTPSMPRASSGSGFFVSSDGYIVTNNHVVAGATVITVSLYNGDTLDAEVIGVDPSSDLAVIKVSGDEPFPYVEFAEADEVKVGDWVVALGNPFSLGVSATAGIVSAINRDVLDARGGGRYTPFIQIDAPINPGNSGGPSFDLSGRVVGVNSQIISRSGGSNGVGFAISSDVAEQVVNALISDGEVRRGWLGVFLQTVDEDFAEGFGLGDARGAIVAQVVDGSPAETGGFRVGDVITSIGGRTVENSLEATRIVGASPAGDTVDFAILRDGRSETLQVTIGARDDGVGEAAAAPRVERESAASVAGLQVKNADPLDLQRLGLEFNEAGVVIERVRRGGAAERIGLRAGMAILAVNGGPVFTADEFDRAMQSAIDNDREVAILTIVDRNGQRFAPLRLNSND